MRNEASHLQLQRSKPHKESTVSAPVRQVDLSSCSMHHILLKEKYSNHHRSAVEISELPSVRQLPLILSLLVEKFALNPDLRLYSPSPRLAGTHMSYGGVDGLKASSSPSLNAWVTSTLSLSNSYRSRVDRGGQRGSLPCCKTPGTQ